MKTDIFLIGPMGSGKTTVANLLVEYGFNKTKGITTRPKRMNESDNEYYFTDKTGFKAAVTWDDIRAVRTYATVNGIWSYGIPFKEFQQDRDTVTIIDPITFRSLGPDIGDSVFGVFLDAPEDVCRMRAMARGDDPKEIERRILADHDDFCDLYDNIDEDLYKCIIGRNIFEENIEPSRIANIIIKSIQIHKMKTGNIKNR